MVDRQVRRSRKVERDGPACDSPGRCRFHGGRNPGAAVGNQYALRHGHRTKAAKHEATVLGKLERAYTLAMETQQSQNATTAAMAKLAGVVEKQAVARLSALTEQQNGTLATLRGALNRESDETGRMRIANANLDRASNLSHRVWLIFLPQRRRSTSHALFDLPGKMPIILQIIDNMTSSAPPPIDIRRKSR